MALAISILSLFISALTFWLTRIWKGQLKMTRPTIICLVGKNGGDEPKVFLRTLLYCTSDQGQYIQNMFIRIYTPQTGYDFNIWAYGDSGLVRGSGLFVSKTGVSIYHHFLLSKNEQLRLIAGNYKLEVYAENSRNVVIKLFEQELTITNEQATALGNEKAVYFNWASNKGQYVPFIESKVNLLDITK
ncbi:hypothetical protein [Niabella sp.]|uniref:hypothetical protein n=1 Tax=Niabella sp. TaxID=1962976 RepID=UPI0026074797|nr:hypothetical protein [Niabella sp.]